MCLCMCVYVCMCVCVCVCVCVCMCAHTCMHVSVCSYIQVCMLHICASASGDHTECNLCLFPAPNWRRRHSAPSSTGGIWKTRFAWTIIILWQFCHSWLTLFQCRTDYRQECYERWKEGLISYIKHNFYILSTGDYLSHFYSCIATHLFKFMQMYTNFNIINNQWSQWLQT